jgi:guanylate kinase
MEIQALLISGTPASGKDTLSDALAKTDSNFIHFRKHKIASGGKLDDSYFLVTSSEFEDIKRQGGFIQSHERYGRGYGVSVEEFNRVRFNSQVPIIHVGKYENLKQFRDYGLSKAISILIFTDRNTTAHRLALRHGNDSPEIHDRLIAYDEEISLLREHMNYDGFLDFNLVIENNGSDIKLVLNKLIEGINVRPSFDKMQDLIRKLLTSV